jgi:hypothetical protein
MCSAGLCWSNPQGKREAIVEGESEIGLLEIENFGFGRAHVFALFGRVQ